RMGSVSGQPFPLSSIAGYSRYGKELFYIALDGRLMAVPILLPASSRAIEAGNPVALFVTQVGGAVQGTNEQYYVASSDGQQFLMNTIVAEASAAPITVILNWHPERRK